MTRCLGRSLRPSEYRNCPSNVLPDLSWRYWASFVVVGVSCVVVDRHAVSDWQRWAGLESRVRASKRHADPSFAAVMDGEPRATDSGGEESGGEESGEEDVGDEEAGDGEMSSGRL